MSTEVADEVRRVLREHARLPVDPTDLEEHADLFAAGMSSHASVSVMLALEDAFDLEFPDAMLTRRVFQSISSMIAAIERLQKQGRP